MAKKFHQQASGAKAGYWVVCNAEQACRLNGQHVDALTAEVLNKVISDHKVTDEMDVDQLKAELAYLDAQTAELYPDLPAGVSIKTVSTLEYAYDALSDDAKDAAFENWLTTHDFDNEIDNIRDNLKEIEDARIPGFTPQAIIGIDLNGKPMVEFQGEFTFTPDEADALIAELSEEDLEELEVYAGWENKEQIKDALVRQGVAFVYPKRYTEGVYTNTVDFSDSELVDTETFQKKIAEQAAKYSEVAGDEWDYATSKIYFEEVIADYEGGFDENGNYSA